MVAPITWLGEVRGVLGVCSREVGTFDDADLEVVDAFARSRRSPSTTPRASSERERQARIQRGFYRIAEVLGSTLSLAETLDALAQAAAEALGGVSAFVLEPRGGRLRSRRARPAPGAASTRSGRLRRRVGAPCGLRARRRLPSTRIADDERFAEAWRGSRPRRGRRRR